MRITLIIAFIAAIAVGGFIWHYRSVIEENGRLTLEVLRGNATIQMLDEKAEGEEKIRQISENRKKDIQNAPESDDAPVAPVLDRLLDSL